MVIRVVAGALALALVATGGGRGAPAVAAQARAGLPRATEAAIDRAVAEAMAAQRIPGLALGVVRDGRLVLARGYGIANLEHNVPVTPETVFKIGSVSKQFLAAGVLLLAQDGKLALDDPVSRHLSGTPPTWEPITLRQLLSHTAGVIREGPAYTPIRSQPDSVVVQSAFGAALLFAPGTGWQYCNVCYFALADVIRIRGGQPWPEFMAERVFRPAGMLDTRTTTTTELVPRRASGYVWQAGQFAPAPEVPGLRPSGAFLSTVRDLARWDSVLTRGALLSSASRDEMWTPARLADGTPARAGDGDDPPGYGLGWQIGTLDGRRRIHHGGSLPGFRAQYARYPDQGLAVIVLTNGDGARPAEIEAAIARLILGPPR